MERDDSKELGYALSSIRSLRGMKQCDVATLTALSPPYISQIFSGKRMPDWDSMKAICTALNIPMTTVVFMVENKCLGGYNPRLAGIIENTVNQVL